LPVTLAWPDLGAAFAVAPGPVSADAVRELLGRCPDITLAWAQALAVTVRRLTGAAADLVFLDLPRRLAKLLLDRADDRARVDFGMSQTEVAAMLGVTRQSLNRALGGLTRRGWVELDGGTVVLLDRAALLRFAAS
jgi:CRP-like cAMP-binding protein